MATAAQRLAEGRRRNKAHSRIESGVWAWVEHLLRKDWSPEQISGWLGSEKSMRISHEWIYLYIYKDKRQGGDLHLHLRCQKARRKRYGSKEHRGQIKGRVSIDERQPS